MIYGCWFSAAKTKRWHLRYFSCNIVAISEKVNSKTVIESRKKFFQFVGVTQDLILDNLIKIYQKWSGIVCFKGSAVDYCNVHFTARCPNQQEVIAILCNSNGGVLHGCHVFKWCSIINVCKTLSLVLISQCTVGWAVNHQNTKPPNLGVLNHKENLFLFYGNHEFNIIHKLKKNILWYM